jgi:2-haloacid dehalogenase
MSGQTELAHPPRALLFDVFGTCVCPPVPQNPECMLTQLQVDWRSTVTDALFHAAHKSLNAATASIASATRFKATDMTKEDWGQFAQQWRNSYMKFTRSLADNSALKWKTVDEHHLDSLRELLAEWQLEGLWTDEEIRALSLIWHRLNPWQDSEPGIKALNGLYWTCTLSNGNLSLLNDLKVYAKLEFTHVFSAEEFGSYKPNPAVYLGAAEKLGLPPNECGMVAAHLGDLKAAKGCGFQTVFVERPQEEDAEKFEAAKKEGFVDVWVTSEEDGFLTAAEKLGIQVDRPRRRSSSNPTA